MFSTVYKIQYITVDIPICIVVYSLSWTYILRDRVLMRCKLDSSKIYEI